MSKSTSGSVSTKQNIVTSSMSSKDHFFTLTLRHRKSIFLGSLIILAILGLMSIFIGARLRDNNAQSAQKQLTGREYSLQQTNKLKEFVATDTASTADKITSLQSLIVSAYISQDFETSASSYEQAIKLSGTAGLKDDRAYVYAAKAYAKLDQKQKALGVLDAATIQAQAISVAADKQAVLGNIASIKKEVQQ